jgi:hypothetical protein
VPASDPQAVLLVNQAQLALTGGVPVSDVLLNGNAQWTVGGATASGPATLKAKGGAEARLDIAAGTFARSEIRNDTDGGNGAWSGTDGVRHATAPHNCWGPASWFSPVMVVQAALASNTVLRYVERTNWNGSTADHVQMFRYVAAQNPKQTTIIQSLSTVEIYLDAASHLPLAVAYSTHPDDDYSRNIAVEISFSDYRRVSGVNVPFHIQRFLQRTLNLDVTVTSATINPGLSDTEFALQ